MEHPKVKDTSDRPGGVSLIEVMLKPFQFNPSEPTLHYTKESRVIQQLICKFVIVERLFSIIITKSQVALKGQGCEGLAWINSYRDTAKWRAVVKTAMNLAVPWNAGNFCTISRATGFSEVL
jgi:hypothetical protein